MEKIVIKERFYGFCLFIVLCCFCVRKFVCVNIIFFGDFVIDFFFIVISVLIKLMF